MFGDYNDTTVSGIGLDLATSTPRYHAIQTASRFQTIAMTEPLVLVSRG